MEEPQEVQTDENRALPEKKQKRIVKTPAQVAALENFYNEHKYPTEGMKQDLAESIGLTEKQVSGWFCHRRLKDKKFPNDEFQTHVKQDRSSGVIQDRGSGLRQDSCGSTKQGGDHKHSDPKEVESKRFTTEALLPIQVSIMDNDNDNDDDEDDDDDDDDDTSSGSSLPLKESFHPQNVGGVVPSKYPSHRSGPSGYLKVKGQAENAAITAVKRQLGRHYREDGPPLGIEFEQLPPGAFENPPKIPVNQSFYVGDRAAIHSPDGSRTFQPPNTNKMYERYNPKTYHPMDLDDVEVRHASKHREKNSDIIKNRHSLSGRSLQMEVNDDFTPRNHLIKHGPGVRRPDSLSNRHPVAHGKNVTHNMRPIMKDDEFDGGRRGLDEYSKLISAKINQGNEMRVNKRSREEFIHQVYPRKEVVADVPPRANIIKRPIAQMTSSFSDDETAETTSSAD